MTVCRLIIIYRIIRSKANMIRGDRFSRTPGNQYLVWILFLEYAVLLTE